LSPPLAHDGHLAGVPKVSVNASIALPDANRVTDVYNVDASDRATLISAERICCRVAVAWRSTCMATTGSSRPAIASACC
jgi:hypothetical protein